MQTRSAPARPGSGFEAGGVLDASAPSWSLARLADAVTRNGRLAELDDDELTGALRTWRRLESWCCSGMLTAIAELARRRPAERTAPAPPGGFPAQLSEFTGDEMAAALTLSGRMADVYLALALDLATRLPRTASALHEGVIDYPKARLIAEATRILADGQARQVEALILAKAGRQTLGQLRAAVARAVITVDPQAAARRREEAQKDPRVRRWQEDAGTAALAGFGLPPDEVLEADQRITARALALRAAGLTGSLDQLRARAYLDTLLGQDSARTAEPRPTGRPSSAPPSKPAEAAPPRKTGPPPEPACPSRPASTSSDPAGPAASTRAAISPHPSAPVAIPSHPAATSPDPAEPARPTLAATADADPVGQRRLAARLNLTVPLTTLLGLAAQPGSVAGFGPVDPSLAQQLAALAAAHPASRCCLTITGDEGQPIGHGCAPGPVPLASPGPVPLVAPSSVPPHAPGPAMHLAPSSVPPHPLGSAPPRAPSSALPQAPSSAPPQAPSSASPFTLASPPSTRPFTVTIRPLARGSCDHRHQEPGYQPSRQLRHLIIARTPTCSAPGCQWPAARCDLDHTLPYDQGGRTCECGLAPLCRHHHRCKQSGGWRLEQTQPGVMTWTTPAGRRYTTAPGPITDP